MGNSISWSIILPTLLVMIQSFLFLLLAKVFLRRLKLLELAFSDTNKAIINGAIFFAVLLISSASIDALYESYIVDSGIKEYRFSELFSRFSRYFFLCLVAEAVFMIVAWVTSKLVIQEAAKINETEEINVSTSILFLFIIVGFAIVFFTLTKSICNLLIPITINFR